MPKRGAIEFKISRREMDRVTKNMGKYGDGVRRRLKHAVEDTLLAVQREAVRLVPVKRGNLKRTIRPDKIGSYEGRILVGGQNDVDYASDIEYGTKAHTIEPVNATILRFKVGGQIVWAKKVNHPGTAAQPFMAPAAESQRQPHIDRVVRALRPNA